MNTWGFSSRENFFGENVSFGNVWVRPANCMSHLEVICTQEEGQKQETGQQDAPWGLSRVGGERRCRALTYRVSLPERSRSWVRVLEHVQNIEQNYTLNLLEILHYKSERDGVSTHQSLLSTHFLKTLKNWSQTISVHFFESNRYIKNHHQLLQLRSGKRESLPTWGGL